MEETSGSFHNRMPVAKVQVGGVNWRGSGREHGGGGEVPEGAKMKAVDET
jgi:hypothetical protein